MYGTLLVLKLSYFSYCFSTNFFEKLNFFLENIVRVKILQAFSVATGMQGLHKQKSCLYSFDKAPEALCNFTQALVS